MRDLRIGLQLQRASDLADMIAAVATAHCGADDVTRIWPGLALIGREISDLCCTVREGVDQLADGVR